MTDTPLKHGVFSPGTLIPSRLFASKDEAVAYLQSCADGCFYAPVRWTEDRGSITGYTQSPETEGRIYK